MDWISIAGGLVVLTIGAELLIRGSTTLARRFGVSDLLIGLTLVGFGTSTPELVSSIQAALVGSPGVAVGNVVGSNIANILLILGLSALIAPFAIEPNGFRRDGIVVLLATLAAIAASMTGEFTRIAGALFLGALASCIAYAFLTEKKAPASPAATVHAEEGASAPAAKASPAMSAMLALGGLALLIVGAKYLVSGAISLASDLGVSETIIGLTIVAVGTSLPELVTSVMAALRGKSALALGNVVGSNIYNILGILGVTALIQPVAAPVSIVAFDNWVMLGATLAMILFATTQSRLTRLEGGALVACYAAYIGWLIVNS
ncbi:MAG TPA: calcium/sodium antiporter [Parvularculaceae bacterium]|nr:calcium/sodium antiporter [Parvularculaceae bacterium]